MGKGRKAGFFHQLNTALIGNEEKYPFEHRFLNAFTFSVGTTSLLGFIVELVLDYQ
jgi:hypothetical protein